MAEAGLPEPLLVPLPGGSWRLWSGAVLRSAGFPVGLVGELAGVELAATADSAIAGVAVSAGRWPEPSRLATYEAEFERTADRLRDAIRSVVADARFSEALIWQNPEFARDCIARLAVSGTVRDRRHRKWESAVAKYVQRYATKNDTIGFFGPVGWASWSPRSSMSRVDPGPELARDRAVSLEAWAVEAVADALARDPRVAGALAPEPSPAVLIAADGSAIGAGGATPALSDERRAVLALCDGARTAAQIAATLQRPTADVLADLSALERDQLLLPPLRGPLEPHADRRLLDRVRRLPPEVADAAIDVVTRLRHGTAAVAAAAGDPGALARAIQALDHEFEQATSRSSRRLAGRTYAGRTVVYEDARRDVAVELGAPVLAALGEPLSCLLDSARWLLARVGDDLTALLEQRFDRRRARLGGDAVPLGALLASMAPDLYTGGGMPPVVAAAVQELRRRWARVLGEIDPATRWARFDVADVRERVSAEFQAEAPRWASAACHSPDIMIAAPSADALNQGRFLLVVGELHLAYNTVESAALVEQHPDRARLRAMAAAMVDCRRVVLAPPREWGYTTRTVPSADVMSAAWTYWALTADDSVGLPAPVIPAAALEVLRVDGELCVRNRLDGRTFPLLEVIGAHMSAVSVNAFSIVAPRRHLPRISIGQLVVARERWTLPARSCAWAQQLDERRRYLQMREWVGRWGLPRHAFYLSPLEAKPVYVDFTSVPLVNNLAAAIRRLTRDDARRSVTISEMLPGPDDCWLVDAEGRRYACELRAVVTDHAG